MKKKIINLIIVFCSIFILIEVLLNKVLIYNSINYSLKLWVNNIIPSLFPFFVFSDILLNYNVTQYIPKSIKKAFKAMFNISDHLVTIFILSMISGFPSNARNTKILYEKGKITEEEANHILIFSHFSNPLFILTTISLYFFNNSNVGIILILSHYLSNFILGIILRSKNKSNNKEINSANISTNNFGNTFINAIKRSINTILNIGGIVTIFLVISAIITTRFKFNTYNSILIKCIFEITIGIDALSQINLNLTHKLVITSMVLSFGGLSVHMQVLAEIINTKIKYRYFLIGRFYQMILSGIITYIICLFTTI